MNTVEVIDQGLRCLSENMGPEKTELFIATLLKERFDYTEWRQGITERINTFEALDAFVETGKKEIAFRGSPKVTL